MLWWTVDNFVVVLVVLGLVAFCLGAVWWSNRKAPYLIACGAVVLLMCAVAGLALTVVTDRQQLALNVAAIRDAVNEGKVDNVLQFFADEITVELGSNNNRVISKDMVRKLAEANMVRFGVKRLDTGTVHVDELTRPNAKVQFMMHTDEGTPARCFAAFEYGSDGKWRVNRIRVETFGGTVPLVVFPFGDKQRGF